MWQEHMQQYECNACKKLIPKSQPVVFTALGGKELHFCDHHCYFDYIEEQQEQMVSFAEGE